MANLSGGVLVQRFRLDVLHRQDELGDYYRGWDLKRDLPLNILVLRAGLAYDPTLLSFNQGQLTLQTLAHPHIVPFYGLYQDHNISFMVERLTEGQLLADILAQRHGQPAPVEEALIYLKAISSAAGYAHGFGLVHCNIKPAHILLENSGNILLAGFGFARSADSPMTASGIAGVPAYMAPEAIRREAVTSASDIYSMGMVLFELVAGRHPFLKTGESLQSPGVAERLADAHLNQPPPDPRTYNPAIPAGLAQLTAVALAKSPRERYQSSQEMLEVACAVLGKSPDQLPDHLATGPSAADVPGVLVTPAGPALRPAAPGAFVPPPASYAALPFYQPGESPGAPRPQSGYVPPTQVAQPGYVPPTQAAQPGYVPPTQVVSQPSYATYPLPQSGSDAPSQRLAPHRKAFPWTMVIIAGIVIFLCLAAAAAGGGLLLLNGLATPTPTPTLVASATPPPTTPPTAAQPVPPTQPAGLMASDTPLPSPTTPPTNTPAPTPTRPPTNTPMPSSFTVTIRNNLGYPILAHRDGQLMGTDPIPPGMYIFYRGIPPGVHNFEFCDYEQPSKCPYQRTEEINSDTTITVP
jgi:serine/threonine protein kinase